MHLAHARLGQVERRADFLHRHPLKIIEHDDELLGPRKAVAEHRLDILTLHRPQPQVDVVVLDDEQVALFVAFAAANLPRQRHQFANIQPDSGRFVDLD